MRPLVPVLLAFISGIIIEAGWGFPYWTVYAALAISFIPPIFFYVRGLRFSRYVAALPFFFLGALFILPYIRPVLPRGHIREFVESSAKSGQELGALGAAVEGVVTAPPDFANGRTRLNIEAKRVLKDNVWMDTGGTVLLSVEGEDERFGLGDRVRFVGRLREPMNFGNPGEFDYRGFLNRKGIFVTGYVKNGRLIEKIGAEEGAPGRSVERVRGRIRSFIDGSGLKNGDLIKAVVIAESHGIDPAIREAFVRTGTVHILVIAGLHVGFVALFAYGVFLFLLKRSERVMLAVNVKKLAALLTVAPVVTYGLLAGFPVSTKRAIIMAVALTASFIFNRGKDIYNTLVLAALVILIVYPYALWETAFQLSFAAVFSIIYLVPRFEGFLDLSDDPLEKPGLLRRFLSRKVMPAFFVTVAASIGTTPVLAHHFHRVSVVGLAANLVAVPLTGIILPAILSSLVISPFWEGLARVPLFAADIGFELMVRVIRFFSGLPYASVWVTAPTLLEICLFYALVVCAVNFRKKRVYAYLVPVIIFVFIIDWGWWNYGRFRRHELKVTFISVGQGESGLIEFPGGSVMLIDGGGQYGSGYDIGEKVLAPFLWSKKIKKIDYMVLSHAQYDHMAGLKFIARNFSVNEFWWNGDGSLGALGRALSEGHASVRVLDDTAGRISLGGATVEVLHPHRDLPFDQNNMCLVLRVTYGSESFLFTGDIGEDAERELVKKDVRAVVLKAPHHGSRYSSSPEFLQRVSPSVVVVSAGRGNVFGFPHRETLERYGLIGAKVYRTDKNGAITFTTDGKVTRENAYLTDAAP
jgi:competence protein ComEC